MKLEPDSAAKGRALVRYDAATGKRDVWVPAARLVPAGRYASRSPVEDYAVSPDGKRLLMFTNTQKVWRQNTRGDYWVLDLATRQLQQARRRRPTPSTLMFAKFSPDGNRVAYVREHNLYVERLADGAITQLTTRRLAHDHQRHLRLGLRGGARPARRLPLESRRPAHRVLAVRRHRRARLPPDQRHRLALPVRRPVQYPKAGTTNSAVRVGVVSADGGATRVDRRPRRPAQQLPRADGLGGSSNEVVLQQLNRLQNTIEVMLGDAQHRAARTMFTERDSAWVDVDDDLRWIDGGKSFPGQRARRLAAPLPRLARRHDAAGSSRRARSTCTTRPARSASRAS